MIDLQKVFSDTCKEIEAEGKTTLPKPVTIVAWERFEAGCHRSHEQKGEAKFRALFPVQGPQYVRWLIGQALTAYCK